MMELLPPEIRSVLPKLHDQEKTDDPFVHIKYFFPMGNWTWFVTEGEPRGNDFLFFGYVIGPEKEWGYFTLQQLEEINWRGLTVERDLFFKKDNFTNCIARWESEHGIA